MSQSVPYEMFKTSPPTYEEAIHKHEMPKEETTHSQQEGCPSLDKPTGEAPPVLLAMPVPLRDVGRGNIVYVVNGPERSDNVDSDGIFGPSFENKAIRAVFVRKVYTTLMLQLLVTVILIAWFLFHDATRHFVRRSMPLLIAAYITFLVTYIILICCSSVRRSWPCNLIMLSIFTLSMSYWAATISAFHNTYIVLMTVGIVTVVCLGISIFSIQTKWDITGAGIYLFVFLLVVVLFGILTIALSFIIDTQIMTMVYSGLLALVFALYLVYDTQQIIGGRKVELSPEEHIFGALQLYIDIINIYVAILSLSSSSCK